MRTRLEGRAPAKVNLTLEVLGRRPDGYHALASVFHTLSLSDRVRITLSPLSAPASSTLTLQATGFPVPTDERNSVWQALTRFFAHWQGTPLHCEVWLEKQIPTQAGLGGGSSDAGIALKLLAEWAQEQGYPPPDLLAIAQQVGSDVPFFLNGACALVEGRGEQVRPLPPLPPFWWVLAKPPDSSVPTAWAYQQLQRPPLQGEAKAPTTEQLVSALLQGAIRTPEDLAPYLHNDFEAVVLPAHQPLQTLRTQMEAQGVLRVLLCGSGAVQAGLCHNQSQAEAIAHTLRQQGYWSVGVQLEPTQ